MMRAPTMVAKAAVGLAFDARAARHVLWLALGALAPCLMASAVTVTTLTADGNGTQIQSAIDEIAQKGGGRVVVTAGIHDVGSLRLRSHVELHLERGAVLRGSDKSGDYIDFPDSVCSIHPEGSKKILLYAFDAEDVAITGEGIVDGQGPKFFDTSRTPYWGFYAKPPVQRPRMVQFVRVRGVRLSGVTFKDSPCWTMLLRFCENVAVDGITVTADQKMINNDGIDFDACRHVTVRRSRFKTGDDCLIVRAMREAGSSAHVVCEDIVFSECDLDSRCQTIRLGCPSDDTIRNVRILNVRARGNNGIFADYPERYLRAGDAGFMDIHDVLVDGYMGEFSGRALQIVSEPGVRVRNVDGFVFRNVKVKSRKPLRFIGNAGCEIKSVRLENVAVAFEGKDAFCRVSGCQGLVFDRVTVNGVRQPDGRVNGEPGSAVPLKRSKTASREATTTSNVSGVVSPHEKRPPAVD